MMAAAFIAWTRRISRACAGGAAALAIVMHGAAWAQAAEPPRLITHQSYVEETLRATELRLDDPRAVFAWVLGSLPERVKVYPTENYFYFHFVHNGLRYAGNIRLDAKDRDRGKLHFAYFEDLSEWREEPAMNYRVFDKAAGVAVDKIERFLYRVTYRDKSVLFELNDLTAVAPPPGLMLADENYLGPVFDDSAIRFFLLYNARLKLFHYVLDETLTVNEHFLTLRETDRIVVGKRSGFAFYRDPRNDRKILVGVFEGNARVNNVFDGPFDQLPDNFIQGDALRKAMMEADPSLRGRIDRYGGLADGSGRVLVAPYTYYRTPTDLLAFHRCVTDKRVPAADTSACFAMDWAGEPEIAAIKRLNGAVPTKAKKPRKNAMARSTR